MIYAGIDLGGTNIAAAIVDAEGVIISYAEMPTLAYREVDAIVDDMVALVIELLAAEGLGERALTAVGVGVPGLVDPATKVVHSCPNLGWQQVALEQLLRQRLPLPIALVNDANSAALAELHLGAFKGRQSAVLITLGSGVGGAVILNGKLHIGAYGAAGEIGHMVIHLNGEVCDCGNRGCFERYASAQALTRLAQARFGQSRLVGTLPTGARVVGAQDSLSPELDSAKAVIDAAKAGNEVALSLFHEYVSNLSKGVVSLINLYDPEVIALGGGVSEAGAFLLDAVRDEVRRHVFVKGYPHADIVLTELGNKAGVIGAALHAMQNARQ